MYIKLKRVTVLLSAVLLALVFSFGCAHRPLNDGLAVARIRLAEEAGADDVPRASVHLYLAKKELKNARVLSNNGQSDEAESMLMRVKVDVAMAMALFMEATEKAESNDAKERVVQLRKQSD